MCGDGGVRIGEQARAFVGISREGGMWGNEWGIRLISCAMSVCEKFGPPSRFLKG